MLSPRKSNRELALHTLQELAGNGVRTVIVCPGARNSAWVEALLESSRDASLGFSFEVLNHFDERAAGFAALGRARASTKPVAVLTTSGSAAGELLPAAMEAFYTGTRIFFLTADRPRRFRGTGSPQACEQVGIFGVYCSEGLDIDGESTHPFAFATGPKIPAGRGPAHWNVCFEEPQTEAQLGTDTLATPFDMSEAKHPLVIVGELSRDESRIVSTVLRNWGYPVITEALSQLSTDSSLDELRIEVHHGLWQEAIAHAYPIDAVIRIGGVPTLRFWRDLEAHPEASKIPVLSISSLPFSGLPRAKALQMLVSDIYRLTVPAPRFAGTNSTRDWRTANHARRLELLRVLGQHPASEPGVFRALSEEIPENALVYLGNSLPIREWDLCAHRELRFASRTISASRGLNGIDGQLSTFFGMISAGGSAATGAESWAILGDLTALYDSTAPWILREFERAGKAPAEWHLAIINNSGGRIFERLFGNPAYINEHSIGFEHWAKQWNLSYARIEGTSLREFMKLSRANGSLPQILEIIPDSAATSAFWKEWEGT
jgi:2-succinyl-5-enolpyruvyl-6-hydroxy-3-cyclohexene-1-carboxylate synthase